MSWSVLQGDCLSLMREMEPETFHAIVTDPPYGLEFMGKEWDAPWKQSGSVVSDPVSVGGFQDGSGGNPYSRSRIRIGIGKGFQDWCYLWAVEALRVAKPGAHLLAFGSSRTFHRLVCAIEDAGWEVRDTMCWIFGQGFPKNLNVSERIRRDASLNGTCACGPRSTRTVPGSQSDCPGRSRSDGGLLLGESSNGPGVAPSLGDAPERSHDGPLGGDLVAVQANTCPGEASCRPSSDCSLLHDGPQSEGSRSVGSTPSGTRGSRSRASQTESRKTELRKPGTPSSERGSEPLPCNTNIPHCPDCGGVIIPDGLGTALKPAVELICLARKPLEGTVAQNVLKHGCGALDIDGSRIAGSVPLSEDRGTGSDSIFGINSRHPCGVGDGRWPSNVIFDPESARLLDEMSGESVSRQGRPGRRGVPGEGWGIGTAVGAEYADSGGASRYFYTAKADQSERPEVDGIQHPTVKPLDLMRYLVGLVSREGDMVLEPFAGSGTTVAACVGLGRNCTRSELNPDYVRLIEKRMQTVTPSLFSKEAV